MISARNVGLVAGRCPCPAVPASGGGRATSGAASTNSLAVASGQMTVPMSRPSITAPGLPPGGSAEKGCAGNPAAPGARPGCAATCEAALPTTSVRMAGSPAERGSMVLRAFERVGFVRGIAMLPPARRAPSGDRARRNPDGRNRNAARASWPACPCPDAAVPSTAMTMLTRSPPENPRPDRASVLRIRESWWRSSRRRRRHRTLRAPRPITRNDMAMR